MGTTYHRVTFRPDDGRSRTVILRNMKIGSLYSGVEVNVHGDEVASNGYDERYHAIEARIVRKVTPLHMNRKYAELEARADALEAT